MSVLINVRRLLKNDRIIVQINLTLALLLLHLFNLFHDLALLHFRSCEMIAILVHFFLLATGIIYEAKIIKLSFLVVLTFQLTNFFRPANALGVAGKSNLHYTRVITPRRVTSGRAHFRGLAHRQQQLQETSKRWRAAGDTVFDLTRSGIEPQTYRTHSDVFHH